MQKILSQLCEEILINGLHSNRARELMQKASLPTDLTDQDLTSEILYRLNMSTLENSLFKDNLMLKEVKKA